MIAEELDRLGYSVREGRHGSEWDIPEVKFSLSDTGGCTHGIDTSFGHRFTISPHESGGHVMYDRKHRFKLHGPNSLALQGAALRAVSKETDPASHAPVGSDIYRDEPNGEPYSAHEGPASLSVDQLRELFPGHYLTK